MFEVFEQTTPLVEGPRLRAEVARKVNLPITVGVARTKFLAKVASGVAKPDGLLVVPPDGELAFLHPLPVRRLWGVEPVTADKLNARGIATVGEVALLGEAALVAMLGRASGRHLHSLATTSIPGRFRWAGMNWLTTMRIASSLGSAGRLVRWTGPVGRTHRSSRVHRR